MNVLEEINGRWGRGTLRTGSVHLDPEWGMRREMMSQIYTTELDQLGPCAVPEQMTVVSVCCAPVPPQQFSR